ncbi:hypothetical protein L2E82_12326 [Cichorium intybus]|uniref:Uncharacterized protein n=1 Tax=Cichorium intybus TaxID=13427 RepID=A0ACB9GGF3_CICIN|nr:hypothetical protein L2E82_12326 [Cichorium intybus]
MTCPHHTYAYVPPNRAPLRNNRRAPQPPCCSTLSAFPLLCTCPFFPCPLSGKSNAPPSLTNHQRIIASQIRMKLAGFLNMYYKNHTFSRNQKHPSSWIKPHDAIYVHGVKQTRGRFGLGVDWSKMSTGEPIEIYSVKKTQLMTGVFKALQQQIRMKLAGFLNMYYKNHTFSRNQKHPSSWIKPHDAIYVHGVKQTRGRFGLGVDWSKMSTGEPIEIYSVKKTQLMTGVFKALQQQFGLACRELLIFSSNLFVDLNGVGQWTNSS